MGDYMQLFRLNEAMRRIVCEFDPFSLLEDEEYSKDDAYGIILEGDEEEEETIAGLLLTRENDKGEPVIDWIYVLPEFRDAGLGSFALDKVFEHAEKEGAAYVHAFISDFYGRELVCKGDEEFFLNNGFVIEKSLGSRSGEKHYKADVEEYIEYSDARKELDLDNDDAGMLIDDDYLEATVGEVAASVKGGTSFKGGNIKPLKMRALKDGDEIKTVTLGELEDLLLSKHISRQPVPVSVGEVSLYELETGLNIAAGNKAKALVADIKDITPYHFDPEFSFVIKEDDDITGIFLVNANAVILRFEILLAFAVGEDRSELVRKLFLSFVEKAKKEDYPDDAQVVFIK